MSGESDDPLLSMWSELSETSRETVERGGELLGVAWEGVKEVGAAVGDVSPVPSGQLSSARAQKSQLWSAVCGMGFWLSDALGRLGGAVLLSWWLGEGGALVATFVVLPGAFVASTAGGLDDVLRRQNLLLLSLATGFLHGYNLRRYPSFSPLPGILGPLPSFLLPILISLSARFLLPRLEAKAGSTATDRRMLLLGVVGIWVAIFGFVAVVNNSVSLPCVVWLLFTASLSALQLQLSLATLSPHLIPFANLIPLAIDYATSFLLHPTPPDT